jgi:DNA-directed RNA polymerase specialized sigma subunit
MIVKEYLSQTWRINSLIDAKLEQAQSLKDLATKATATLSDTPRSSPPNAHRMEDIIVKMIDLENEINADIDVLVNLKREIGTAIKSLDNADYRVLLELRYLCFKTWEEIAACMHYAIRNVHYIHGKALKEIACKIDDCTIIC